MSEQALPNRDIFDRPLPVHPRWKRALLGRVAAPFLCPDRRGGNVQEPGPAPWREVEVRSPDGSRLAAWAALRPEHDAPALLFAHGHTSSVEETQYLGNVLWERGFHTFVFEFRACGTSEGKFVSFTRLETGEVEAAFAAFAQLLPEGTPIGAHGFSMGAASIINALKRGLPVRRVSLDCPLADLRETVEYFLRTMPLHARLAAPFCRMAAEQLLGVRVGELRPLDGVEEVRQPALFILSTNDAVVPPRHTRQLMARWGGPADLWEHEGIAHCQARFACWDEYVDRLAAWHGSGVAGAEECQLASRGRGT